MGDKHPTDEWNRREFMEWASAVGLLALAPGTVSAVADAREAREKPDSVSDSDRGSPVSGTQLHHPLERGVTRARRERFERDDDPTVFYEHALADELSENRGKSSLDVVVETVGRRNTVETNRRGRTIDGWQPTPKEVDALSSFGDVGFVGKFIGPIVSLKDVTRSDLTRIAALDDVLSVNYDPPGGNGSHDVSVDDLRSTSYYWFSSVEDDYSTTNSEGPLRIGIIDSGYGYDSDYTDNYAGGHIDTALANDFTDDDTGWQDPKDEHGDNVADTVYYMLQEAHDDLFVPLKIHDEDGDPEWSDNIRSAIEYSAENDVDVINISQMTFATYDYCSSFFCSELQNYAQMGYIPVTISGNQGVDGEVSQPGTSKWAVTAGGIDDGSCSNDDYHRDSSSNYATVNYDSCTQCQQFNSASNEFVPDVYGAYHTETDAGTTISGTSFAAPQVAAAALVMQHNELYDYQTARSINRDMDWSTICPTSASEAGQLLDAWDAYHKTN